MPLSDLAIDAAGCLIIGALLVLANDCWTDHRLVRPLLGVGVLGGFAAAATYAVDLRKLVADGSDGSGAAAGWLAGTVTTLLASAFAGLAVARRVLQWWCGPDRPR